MKNYICANLDILLLSQTKVDDSFLSAQFLLDGYKLDRRSNGGGILLYITDDIPSRLFLNSNKTESKKQISEAKTNIYF